jgi:uncharacterized protein (TIGR03435 family)
MNVGRFLLVSIASTALALPVMAQTPVPAGATFEVASVKPNKSGDRRTRHIFAPPGGRYEVINMPLRVLIRLAYPIQNNQIASGPDWLDSDMFDITARVDANLLTSTGMIPKDRQQQMVRALLADRFKLRAHMEKRNLPYYALVMARADRSFGPKLAKAELDCDALIDKGGPFPPGVMGRPEPGKPPLCGGLDGVGHLGGNGRPLRGLANSLTVWVSRVVIDQTGQAGGFNWDLQWLPDQPRQFDAAGGPPDPDQPAQPNPNGMSVFTALEEQLGLKLDSRRGPVDVLVIDHAEQPTPD